MNRKGHPAPALLDRGISEKIPRWHSPCVRALVRRHLCAITTLAIALLKAQGATEVLAEIPFEFKEGLLWVKVTVPQIARSP